MKTKRLFSMLLAASALACGLMLTACSSGPGPEDAIKTEVASQFDAIKNLDQESIDQLASDISANNDLEAYGIDGVAYVTSMLTGFDYEIKDVVVDESGENASATVAITCKSFSDAGERATALSEEFASSGEMMDMTMDEMNKKIGSIMVQAMDETATKTTDCTFEYSLVDGTWTPKDGTDQQVYAAFFA
ncbi:hypothetical protein [uncultured Slackia sp.]|uniref:hypothetical protein n=1 Tax=uncultured Slackia sp. TaxID=665903 RepID=UPI0026DF9177|nr:hypothetical protein [uncultured Slackia sp.]